MCIHTHSVMHTHFYLYISYTHINVYIHTHSVMHTNFYLYTSYTHINVDTGWRRCVECLKLQVSFRKRATNYRALLRKMTYQDEISTPCTHIESHGYILSRIRITHTHKCVYIHVVPWLHIFTKQKKKLYKKKNVYPWNYMYRTHTYMCIHVTHIFINMCNISILHITIYIICDTYYDVYCTHTCMCIHIYSAMDTHFHVWGGFD